MGQVENRLIAWGAESNYDKNSMPDRNQTVFPKEVGQGFL